MKKDELMQGILYKAYAYALEHAQTEDEKKELFYSVIKEAIEHVHKKEKAEISLSKPMITV